MHGSLSALSHRIETGLRCSNSSAEDSGLFADVPSGELRAGVDLDEPDTGCFAVFDQPFEVVATGVRGWPEGAESPIFFDIPFAFSGSTAFDIGGCSVGSEGLRRPVIEGEVTSRQHVVDGPRRNRVAVGWV